MRNTAAIHERFMNTSGTILPRVGVGGGVGVGLGIWLSLAASDLCSSALRDGSNNEQGVWG